MYCALSRLCYFIPVNQCSILQDCIPGSVKKDLEPHSLLFTDNILYKLNK